MQKVIKNDILSGLKSPAVHIPSTPYLQKLGFGTGVSVYLYQRSPKVLLRNHSYCNCHCCCCCCFITHRVGCSVSTQKHKWQISNTIEAKVIEYKSRIPNGVQCVMYCTFSVCSVTRRDVHFSVSEIIVR